MFRWMPKPILGYDSLVKPVTRKLLSKTACTWPSLKPVRGVKSNNATISPCNQHLGSESERCSVRRQMKAVGNSCRREKVARSRIEASLPISIQMNGGREEDVNALAQTR